MKRTDLYSNAAPELGVGGLAVRVGCGVSADLHTFVLDLQTIVSDTQTIVSDTQTIVSDLQRQLCQTFRLVLDLQTTSY